MTITLDYRDVEQPMMLNRYPTAADTSPGQSRRPSYRIEGAQSEPWREVGSHRVSVYHEEDLLMLGNVALPTTRESVHAAEIAAQQLKESEARAIVNLYVEASTFGFYYLVGTSDHLKLEISGSVVERPDEQKRDGTDAEER